MSTVLTKPPVGWDTSFPFPPRVTYPESDGQPVGETDSHISAIFYLRAALRILFRDDPRTYVAGNMMFYYEEGEPSAVKAPDIFVVKGIDKHDRRTYKLWEEGVAPCVVFEITSRSTRLEDLGSKKALYEMLGVQEYFVFDPLDEYLRPRLQGFSLIGGVYCPIHPARDGAMISAELNAILKPDEALLRVLDPRTGKVVPTVEEAVEQAETAEAEVARLRAELARLLGQMKQ
jgi:Uma2 family endonuclease